MSCQHFIAVLQVVLEGNHWKIISRIVVFVKKNNKHPNTNPFGLGFGVVLDHKSGLVFAEVMHMVNVTMRMSLDEQFQADQALNWELDDFSQLANCTFVGRVSLYEGWVHLLGQSGPGHECFRALRDLQEDSGHR